MRAEMAEKELHYDVTTAPGDFIRVRPVGNAANVLVMEDREYEGLPKRPHVQLLWRLLHADAGHHQASRVRQAKRRNQHRRFPRQRERGSPCRHARPPQRGKALRADGDFWRTAQGGGPRPFGARLSASLCRNGSLRSDRHLVVQRLDLRMCPHANRKFAWRKPIQCSHAVA